jgi:hypothetical protein
LRDALTPNVESIYDEVTNPYGDHDDLLLWLAVHMAPAVAELEHWRDIPSAELHTVLGMWLSAEPEERLAERFATPWKAIRPNDLDTLIPWVLTAAIDFVTTETGALNFRELAHRRLAPVRLRYGVPQADMCELVRDGFDREDAVAAAEHFKYAPPGAQMAGLRAYGKRWKREREATLSAAAAEQPF